MITYEFARIEQFSLLQPYGDIVCTNTAELESLVADVQELNLPKLKIYRIEKKSGIFRVSINSVPSDFEMRWWLMKWLCEHGWEPFSHFEDVYSFKRARQ